VASDDRWDANAPAVVEWIRSGGFPETAREDLLRDVVALWDGFTPDHSAWNAAAGFLSALAAMRDAPGRDPQALRALADLAAQVERCAMGTAGAEERAVTAVTRLAALAGAETSVQRSVARTSPDASCGRDEACHPTCRDAQWSAVVGFELGKGPRRRPLHDRPDRPGSVKRSTSLASTASTAALVRGEAGTIVLPESAEAETTAGRSGR